MRKIKHFCIDLPINEKVFKFLFIYYLQYHIFRHDTFLVFLYLIEKKIFYQKQTPPLKAICNVIHTFKNRRRVLQR